MRVLVVHNRYSSRVPSGENLAVDDEVRWLREAGVEVDTHEVSNDDVFDAGGIQRLRQAGESIWSVSARRAMADTVDRVKPDVVHLHNLFPLLSASVAGVGVRRGVPLVWTVHNHRITCVAGTNFRDGAPCHACRPGWRLPGVRYACYADSSMASGLITAATSLFARTARRHTTALAISASLRSWLVDSAGFEPDRVAVKYNGVAGPAADAVLEPAASSRTFLFAGHLTDHKGVPLLLQAWRRLDPALDATLAVAGDGPRADEVRALAEADPRVRWLGHLPPTLLAKELGSSRAVIVPSTWDEPFGRTAAEALAYGRPVLTTGTGGLAEIVDDHSGWITGTDPAALAAGITEAAVSDHELTERARSAQARHQRLFSPEATTKALVAIYEDATARIPSP